MMAYMAADYPEEFVVIICLMFACEILTGLVLNVYVTIKWFKERNSTRGKRSNGTNFIVTLKVIDLVICACVIPFALTVLVVDRRHNAVVCFVKEGFVVFASSGSSVGVLLISFDRYTAVVLPTKQLLTQRRIRLLRWCVIAVGILGFILPPLCLFMGNYRNGLKASYSVLTCRYVIWIFQEYYIYDIYYIVLFIVAVIVVFLCYRSVLQVVRRRMTMRTLTISNPTTSSENTASTARFRRQEFKATRVAFAVVLTFLICWGPHVVVTIVQFTSPSSVVIDMAQSACLVIAFLTPIIHPIIYTFEKVERSSLSTIQSPKSTPFFKSLITRRVIKVTPEQTVAETTMNEQSCSHNRVSVHNKSPSSSQVVSNGKGEYSDMTSGTYIGVYENCDSNIHVVECKNAVVIEQANLDVSIDEHSLMPACVAYSTQSTRA